MHHSEQNLRKRLDGRAVLDLEDNSGLRGPEWVEFLDELRHVLGTSNEREGDQIRVFGGQFEILAVLGRQGRNVQPRIRQVDAFFGAKFGRAVGGMGDPDFEVAPFAVVVDTADNPRRSCRHRKICARQAWHR